MTKPFDETDYASVAEVLEVLQEVVDENERLRERIAFWEEQVQLMDGARTMLRTLQENDKPLEEMEIVNVRKPER